MGLEFLQETYSKLEDGYYSSCDYLQQQLNIPVYQWFVNPVEERGIPSFPLAIFILLLILGGAAFLIFASSGTSLKVVVNSDEGPLDGANVQLIAEGLTKQLTTQKGEALFKGLPKGKPATLRVSKEGYAEEERQIVMGQSGSIAILLSTDSGADVRIEVYDFQGVPLQGALVSYEFSAKDGALASDSGASDSEGKFSFKAPAGTSVSVSASLSGYETKSLTFTAEKNAGPKRLALQKIEPSVSPPNSETSQLTIQVKDDVDGSAVDAELLIYDSFTQDLLKEASTEFGSFETEEFKAGMTLKIVARAGGYEELVKSKTLSARSAVVFRLKRGGTAQAGNASLAIIKVLDEAGAPLASEIRLWEYTDEGNYTLLKKEASAAELRMEVPELRFHYATAFREGYLPGKTLQFLGGETKEIQLVRATANNSLNLTVATYDEDGLRVAQASLAFFDELGDQVPPFELKTDANGKKLIRNFPRGLFRIAASKLAKYGHEDVELLLPNEEVNVTLRSPKGTVEVGAKDWDSNASIQQFFVSAYYYNEKNNSLYGTCTTVNGSCSLAVRADKTLRYEISSPNYETAGDYKMRASPNAVTPLQARLLRLGSSAITRIALESLTDLNGNTSATLTSDTYYLAKFDVYAKTSAETAGAYLRLEGSDGSEIAHVLNYSFSSVPASVKGNEHLTEPNTCTINFNSPSPMKPLAWLEAEYAERGSFKIAFLIKIDPKVLATGLVLKYRSHAISQGEYFRDPEDASLGFARETAAKPWCAANVKNYTAPLIACGNFGEACCSTRSAADGAACNLGYQCLKTSGDSRGVCAYPTSCGSSIYFCSDDTVCCASGSTKGCVPEGTCTTANLRECTPACRVQTEYCDSSGSSAGICTPITGICGKENQQCCSGSAVKCEASLTCNSAGKCVPCGGINQACCAYAESTSAAACSTGLQCVISGSTSTCKNSEICGSGNNACTGATVCCNDPGKQGQCVPYSQCTSQVKCTPDCRFDQYCDARNLNSPSCQSCALNPSACKFGDIGGLCDNTNPDYRCKSPDATCIIQPGSNFGICTSCGRENQQCCSSTQGAFCTQAGTICRTAEKKCFVGNEDCSNSACVSMSFKQRQCRSGGILCEDKTGSAGFEAHSLINCDGTECLDGNLTISYSVRGITSSSLQFPGELKISFTNGQAVRPYATLINGVLTSIDAGDWGAGTEFITIPVLSAAQLSGQVLARPLQISELKVEAAYKNARSLEYAKVLMPISVTLNTPAKPPSSLPNLFSCNKLELRKVRYPGTTTEVLESSCDNIVFQVDSIFPADAIPLNKTLEETCGLFKIKFGTPAEPQKYDGCFDYSSDIGGEALRFWPSKGPTCASLAPVGNSVPAANVTMNVSCGPLDKIINIQISNYSLGDIRAIDASVIGYKDSELMFRPSPKSYYGYDSEAYSPLKLIYVLNNRVRTGVVRDFNDNDEYWAADYALSAGVYSLSPESSQVLRDSEIAAAFAWHSGMKSRVELHSELKSDERSVVPPLIAEIPSTTPASGSIAEKLSDAVLSRPEFAEFPSQRDACKNDCESNAQANFDACIADRNAECAQKYCPGGVAGCDSSSLDEMYRCQQDERGGCEAARVKAVATCSSTCYAGVEVAFDAAYSKALLEEFRNLAEEVARKTAFKRSFGSSMFCTKPDPSAEETQNPGICRSNANDWLTLRKITTTASRSCVFCYDLYNRTYGVPGASATAIDRCDIRCSEMASEACSAVSSTGYCASVKNGESYTNANNQTFTCSSSNTSSCLYECQPQSAGKAGDYCGSPADCSACPADGSKETEEVVGYEYAWEPAAGDGGSRLHEVKITPPAELLINEPLPYKYFVDDPAATPFSFSAVVQLTADMVYNRMKPELLGLENSVKMEGIPAECKARLGIFRLETKTSNGVDFGYAPGYKFGLLPVYVNENYPAYLPAGTGQDYCERTVACNLFDAFSATTHSSMKNWFEPADIKNRCFEWEWPIVPEDKAGWQYGGGKDLFVFMGSRGKFTDRIIYNYDSDASTGGNLETEWIIGPLGLSNVDHGGWYDPWYYTVPPYKLANYPAVFGEARYGTGGYKMDDGECQEGTVWSRYELNIPTKVCGTDVS